MNRQVIHILDWIASIVLAIALSVYLPGVIEIYNVTGNIWAYTIIVIAALAWTIGRWVFNRLKTIG